MGTDGGLENFESDMISEDESLDLSRQHDNEEEDKDDLLDNSFDKHLKHKMSGGKLQIVHHKQFSKTKKKPIHEPLSKHIPKDILSSGGIVASKNLLGNNSILQD